MAESVDETNSALPLGGPDKKINFLSVQGPTL